MKKLVSLFVSLVEFLLYFLFRIYWHFISKKLRVFRAQKNKPRILFASTPIISNKFWARSLATKGYDSKCLTFAVPIINSKDDYDIFFNDIYPIKENSGPIKQLLQKLIVFTYVVKHYDIIVTSFRYSILSQTRFWKKEAFLFKFFGIKVMVMPYGNDFYMYSKLIDHSGKHNMLITNLHEAYNEEQINERAIYWRDHANFIIMGLMLDGAQRWDSIPVSIGIIDTNEWHFNNKSNRYDGKNGIVTIVHTPNHRGIKGSEFIIHAVNELKKEGLKIDLILIEGKQNSEVKKILCEDADILVEQIIFNGYAMSGIEGMACGIPVLSNISRDDITRVFRRYSYLEECPILSTTPENIKDNLRILVTNPQLRIELGVASRQYAQKYHSYPASHFMFETIFDKIWYSKEVDTMNMYHPLNPNSFNNHSPLVKHPLKDNNLPIEYLNKNKSDS